MTHAIYFTDDYPRQGCRLTVDVLRNGYNLQVLAPSGRFLESYPARTPHELACMVEDWCNGAAPRLIGGDGQPASGSEVTA